MSKTVDDFLKNGIKKIMLVSYFKFTFLFFLIGFLGGIGSSFALYAKPETFTIGGGTIEISNHLDPEVEFLGLSFEVICQSRKISLAGTLDVMKIVQSAPCRDFEVKGPGLSMRSEIHAEGSMLDIDAEHFQYPPMLIVYDKRFLGSYILCLAINAHFYDVLNDRDSVKRLPTYCNHSKLPAWWDGSRGVTAADATFKTLESDMRQNYFEFTSVIRDGIIIKIRKMPKV